MVVGTLWLQQSNAKRREIKIDAGFHCAIPAFTTILWPGSVFGFSDKEFGEIVNKALKDGGELTHYELTNLEDCKSIAGGEAPETDKRSVRAVGYYFIGSKTSFGTLTVPVHIVDTGTSI